MIWTFKEKVLVNNNNKICWTNLISFHGKMMIFIWRQNHAMPYVLIYIKLLSFPHRTWLFMISLEYALCWHEWTSGRLNTNINQQRLCSSLAGQRLNWALYEENWCDTISCPLSHTLIFIKQPVLCRHRQLCAAATWQYITLTSLHILYSRFSEAVLWVSYVSEHPVGTIWWVIRMYRRFNACETNLGQGRSKVKESTLFLCF